MKECSIETCNSKHYGKGYCQKHYWQFKRTGKVLENTLKDFNVVIEKNNYYEIILVSVKTNKQYTCKIDKEDLEKVKKVGRWFLDKKGYVANNTGKYTFMHRLIMDAGKETQIDHVKTGKKYKRDNRKKNLRVCTSTQNNWNKSKPKTNTSGYKGVCLTKDGKWVSQICVKGKRIYLGRFDSPEEASKSYQKAAKKYHKEFYNKEKQ